MRAIGVAFLTLAVYITIQSAYSVAASVKPHHSPVGIGWLVATVVAMLGLAAAKARTGIALENPVLRTEAIVTLVDAYLAAAVLVGLVLNAVLGWWWADPFAGLVIVVYGGREGWAALHHSIP
jgi:divalent metal cation (Fe/Co/Zn/Cd) transporter